MNWNLPFVGPNAIPQLGTTLFVFGLALAIGGMLALGAFTAPLVFKSLPRDEAGILMGQIFQRYDKVLLVALALCAIGEVLRWAGGIGQMGLREAVFGIFAGLMLYSTLSLTPQIQTYQTQKATPGFQGWDSAAGQHFDKIHKQAESLYKLELLLAVLLIVLTPYQAVVSNAPKAEITSNP